MDESSGKRGIISKTMAPKMGCNNTPSKSLVREIDQSPQFCSRIGCSGRIKYSHSNKRTQNLDISKCPNSSLGNKVAGNSSSSSSSVITTSKNPYVEGKRKLASQPSESASSSDSEALEVVYTPRSSSSSGHHSKSKKNSVNVIASEASSASGSSKSRVSDHKRTVKNRNTSSPSSISGKRTSLGPINGSSGNKYGFMNLNCSSASDIVGPDSSSSDSNTYGKNTMRERSQETERNSSSIRRERRTTIASSSSSSSSVVSGNVLSLSSGITIPGSGQSSSSPGEDRNRSWTRRSAAMNVNPRTGFSRQNVRNNNVPVGETVVNDVPRVSDSLISLRIGGQRSLRPSSSNVSSTASASLYETESTHLIGRDSLLIGRDSLRRYNMNDISDVLFALEMIEQDEELTHEQVRVLDASLLLGGLNLNLHDQHRDMRLDIDNMSYEELLALEERMGTVSTALSEKEISDCLVKGIFEHTPIDLHANGDDAKCSICQEEYEVGDGMGTLEKCKHGYHLACVTQWLRLKNWCPVCKASAVPASSSSWS